MSQPIEKIAQLQLLSLPTSELLDKFGSGGHKPGSGSGAALVGILSCKFLETVVTLSRGRSGYENHTPRYEYILGQIKQRVEPRLSKIVDEDSIQFGRVIQARRRRDAAKENRQLREIALQELRQSTELPLEIARLSVDLARFGIEIFDVGFRSARGDSGLGISAAISAASSGLFIAYLNLRSFRRGQRTEEELRTNCTPTFSSYKPSNLRGSLSYSWRDARAPINLNSECRTSSGRES